MPTYNDSLYLGMPVMVMILYLLWCAVFEDTLQHPDLSVEMALRTVKVAMQQER